MSANIDFVVNYKLFNTDSPQELGTYKLDGSYMVIPNIPTGGNSLYFINFYPSYMGENAPPLYSMPSYRLPTILPFPHGQYRITITYPDCSGSGAEARLSLLRVGGSFDNVMASHTSELLQEPSWLSPDEEEFLWVTNGIWQKERLYRDGNGLFIPPFREYRENLLRRYRNNLPIFYRGKEYSGNDILKVVLSGLSYAPAPPIEYELVATEEDADVEKDGIFFKGHVNDSITVDNASIQSLYVLFLGLKSVNLPPYRVVRNYYDDGETTKYWELRWSDSSNPDRVMFITYDGTTWKNYITGATVYGNVLLVELSIRRYYAESLLFGRFYYYYTGLSNFEMFSPDILIGTDDNQYIGYLYLSPTHIPLRTNKIQNLLKKFIG